MIRYKENQDWECSVEKMISYLIEANRTITDPKDKKLSNYIVAVRHQLETKDYDTISNRIDTTTYDKYFETTEKWKKIKLLKNNLMEFQMLKRLQRNVKYTEQLHHFNVETN